MTEIKNLEDYETFELVEDVGQNTIGSYWVVTKKEKHDGQKTQYKVGLVARGFQEIKKPQSDSPMMVKKSLKMLMALVANEDFDHPLILQAIGRCIVSILRQIFYTISI